MILVMDDNDHFPMLGETVYVAMQWRQPCQVISIHEDGTITVKPVGQPVVAYWDADEMGWNSLEM